MGSIQEKVTAAILTVIRARRKPPSAADNDLRLRTPGALAPATLREARFSDFSGVAKLKQRWDLEADSLENWERLWRHNPALAESGLDRPIGWVLEAEGAVVGYHGNIALLYRYGDRTLTAVTGHGLVVEPAYRAAVLRLVASFYGQKAVDLYLTTTAIPEVGKIARAFKADPLPQADSETVLFWILEPYTFAQVMIEKLGFQPALASIGSVSTAVAVGIDKLLHRRWPRQYATGFAVSEIGVHEIGDEFQALWMEKLNETPRLLADRSPAALRWHFEIPGDRGNARVLCCRSNGELLGYAVIRNDPEPNGLRKSSVADMLAKQDDPEVLRALLMAAHDHAKRGGSYILEVLGFPSSVRQVCLQWNPYQRKYPACPFYYKAADPVLHKTLSDGMAWYATPFDGDTTLIRASFSSSVPPLGSSPGQIKTTRNSIASEVTEQVKSEAC
jgi:hypothetical protein